MATTYDLIALLGKEDLTRLQAAVGPAQTYIPTKPVEDHAITKAIGFTAMGLICAEFGGTTLWIGNGYSNQQRNNEILRLVLAGIPKENIANCYGITARYVQILTRAEAAPVYARRQRYARRRKAQQAFGRRPIKRRAIVQGLEKAK